MPSLLAHARKQEICLPVARPLVLVPTASQLFKLHTRRSLKDSLKRLDERFSCSLGEGPSLPTEYLLRHLVDALFGSHESPSPSASFLVAGWMPLIGFAERHLAALVMRLGALDDLHHGLFLLSPGVCSA